MDGLVRELTSPAAGMTSAELARRAGINRSTLHRIATGAVQPSVATLRELAIAHGLRLDVRVSALSDPSASAAVRALLEQPNPSPGISTAVQEWIDRLMRVSGDGQPIPMLVSAARASSVLHRDGAVFLRGDASALRLASAGDAAGGGWAVSGAPALELSRPGEMRGPSILWSESATKAAELLAATHRRVHVPSNAQVIVVPADDWALTNAFVRSGVRYAAPIQMLIDAIGIGGDLETAAIAIAEEW